MRAMVQMCDHEEDDDDDDAVRPGQMSYGLNLSSVARRAYLEASARVCV